MRRRYAYPRHGSQTIDLCSRHDSDAMTAEIEAQWGALGPIVSALWTGCDECNRLERKAAFATIGPHERVLYGEKFFDDDDNAILCTGDVDCDICMAQGQKGAA